MIKNTDSKYNNMYKVDITSNNDDEYNNALTIMFNEICKKLDVKCVKKLIDKLSIATKKQDHQFNEFASELIVLYYIIRKTNEYHQFVYEPIYNGKKNPECCFNLWGKTVNIEVKCPNLEKRILQEQDKSTLYVHAADRLPDDIFEVITDLSNDTNIPLALAPRLDNKLKDYLISANNKFPKDDRYINILIISLEIIKDMDEWYNYIFGDRGVFTKNSFVKEDYSKIDVIMLTNIGVSHQITTETGDPSKRWYMEEYLNLLFPNPETFTTTNCEFFEEKILNFFPNVTYEFFNYCKMLDEDSENNNYMLYKEKELSIIPEFVEWLSKSRRNN